MPIQEAGPPPSGEATQPERDDGQPQGGPEAISRLERQLEELVAYLRLYAATRADAWKASLRRLGLWLAVGAIGLVLLTAILAAAAVLAILGLAQLVGLALGDRLWAGYLTTGVGLLVLLGAVLAVGMTVMKRRFRRSTVEKYARRHRQHAAQFGRDNARQSAPERG